MEDKSKFYVDRLVIAMNDYGTTTKNIRSTDLVVLNSSKGKVTIGDLVERYIELDSKYALLVEENRKLKEAFINLAQAFNLSNQNIELLKMEVLK